MIAVAERDQAAVAGLLAQIQDAHSRGGGSALQQMMPPAWALLAPVALTPEAPNGPLGLFSAADLVSGLLTEHFPGTARAERAQEIRTHIRRLAEAAGLSPMALLTADERNLDPQALSDTLASIARCAADIVRLSPLRQEVALDMPLPSGVSELIEKAEAQLQGWCSREKAEYLARAVLSQRPEICVEIGVFGGRSLIPCAAALRELGSGEIYGIESWSPQVSVEFNTSAVNDVWWRDIDYGAIKENFLRFLVDERLMREVRVIESSSQRSSQMFDRIDFLHIDGGHSTYGSSEDVILYVRKVVPGGIVVFDDVNWATTTPARLILEAVCDPIHTFYDEAGQPACMAFRKR
ncbi:class I SAM-dependent methyltransferase [Caulobacter sp. 17J80-11]|uniref:class I SAM-dependent methyltransferase n=1 Tax=Caulobacter sp. 17J80-11 TaxID=2763502 RepID=UPI0016538BD6|nr:class I SAM-dependent methyltransferase [Caulobacter sp. 17J80-11]MBC6983719.1 class I SAM-dependent methyltransferase [Caulobacter sp. 17J80-11]